MAKILTFKKNVAPVEVAAGRKHRVAIEVRDSVRPRRTRWVVQFEIQEAIGFGGLAGFTDRAVAGGYRHRFVVNSTRAVRVLVAELSDLVSAGRIALWVDGLRVRPQIKRTA